MICACRTCGESYLQSLSTGHVKGYCSQRCLWNKLKKFGWTKHRLSKENKTPYAVLKRHGAVGSVMA